jgi:hypothetical protein
VRRSKENLRFLPDPLNQNSTGGVLLHRRMKACTHTRTGWRLS